MTQNWEWCLIHQRVVLLSRGTSLGWKKEVPTRNLMQLNKGKHQVVRMAQLTAPGTCKCWGHWAGKQQEKGSGVVEHEPAMYSFLCFRTVMVSWAALRGALLAGCWRLFLLSTDEATFDILCPALGSSEDRTKRENMDIPHRVQETISKKGLQPLSYKEKLRGLGHFRLGKREHSVQGYLKGEYKEDRTKLFPVVPSDKSTGNGTWKHETSNETSRNTFFCKGFRVLHLGGTQKLDVILSKWL